MRDLKKIISGNIVSGLEETELAKIGQDAVYGYMADDESRAEWKERNKKGMDLAMQIAKKKDFPFENAANVMYPLISIASIQFASRTYPNLIPGYDVVKGKIIGKDDQGCVLEYLVGHGHGVDPELVVGGGHTGFFRALPQLARCEEL